MRIDCNTIKGFGEAIGQEIADGKAIHADSVFVLIDKEASNHTGDPPYDIVFSATFVSVESDDDGAIETLFVLDLFAGRDGSERTDGSDKASGWRQQLAEIADDHNLRVRHGRISG